MVAGGLVWKLPYTDEQIAEKSTFAKIIASSDTPQSSF